MFEDFVKYAPKGFVKRPGVIPLFFVCSCGTHVPVPNDLPSVDGDGTIAVLTCAHCGRAWPRDEFEPRLRLRWDDKHELPLAERKALVDKLAQAMQPAMQSTPEGQAKVEGAKLKLTYEKTRVRDAVARKERDARMTTGKPTKASAPPIPFYLDNMSDTCVHCGGPVHWVKSFGNDRIGECKGNCGATFAHTVLPLDEGCVGTTDPTCDTGSLKPKPSKSLPFPIEKPYINCNNCGGRIVWSETTDGFYTGQCDGVCRNRFATNQRPPTLPAREPERTADLESIKHPPTPFTIDGFVPDCPHCKTPLVWNSVGSVEVAHCRGLCGTSYQYSPDRQCGSQCKCKDNPVQEHAIGGPIADALKIINGARSRTYGPPQESFDRIARYWSLWLEHEVSGYDVMMMMVLFKTAREQFKPHRDNAVDIGGYIGMYDELDKPK